MIPKTQSVVLNQNIGWQSWSSTTRSLVKFPKRYFSPFKDIQSNTLSELSATNNKKDRLLGWSSWCYFGTNINEKIILDQANEAKKLGLKYILIDDGWTTWGDWLTPNPQNFPSGLKLLGQKINNLGLKMGIWWAPMLAKKSSQLYLNHPDWFVNKLEGTQVSPLDIFIKDKRMVLNLENNDVQQYLQEVLEYFKDSNVELLKSDFLYANHFNKNYTSSQTPDKLLTSLLAKIRQFEFYVIACGCPILPAMGNVDAIRISDDINYPQLNGFWPLNKIVVSKRLNQLKANLTNRIELGKFCHLDPDVLITDPKLGITKKQATILADTIKNSSGVIFLGDNLKNLRPFQASLISNLLSTTIFNNTDN